MPNRKVYHVTPHAQGGWQGKVEGAARASVVAATKDEATQRTRELARHSAPSQVIVHGQDGSIQDEHTYEGDPFPPEG